MWLKSTVRQLQKWVPTSTEIRNVAAPPVLIPPATMTAPALPTTGEPIDPDPSVLEEDDDDVSDAVLVDSDGNEVDSDGNIVGATPAAPTEPEPGAPKAPRPPPPPTADENGDPTTLTAAQSKALNATLRDKGYIGPSRFPVLASILDREVTTTGDLTPAEASKAIDALKAMPKPEQG